MKNILGLDLGTNSIGWAVVKTDDNGNYQPEITLGSRIIPMSQEILGNFEGGAPIETQTANRTRLRSIRRLYQRRSLRRERLLRVLHTLGWLPEHFDKHLGWDRTNGKTFAKPIDSTKEVKLPWKKSENGEMQFLFCNSFAEMLMDFAKHQPQMVLEGKQIPYDWTFYYLRHKALTAELSNQELAWILLGFNQKRGYYQLRGKDEELNTNQDKSKLVEYLVQKIIDVKIDPNSKTTDRGDWYNVYLENGYIYTRQSRESLMNWIGKTREFIVTTDLDEFGKPKLNKDGEIKRSFRSPKPDDWSLRKVRTEKSLAESNTTVGDYIYQSLLANPSAKIIGDLVQTIDRDYYRNEVVEILKSQARFNKQLTDESCLSACIIELYPKNKSHAQSLSKKTLVDLIVDDILYYQRPLRSQKSLIADCPYEYYKYVNKKTGEINCIQHVKCASKSNPWFQEFRIRQFIMNLRIYKTDGLNEIEVTNQWLKDKDAFNNLYNWLRDRKTLNETAFLTQWCGIKKQKNKLLGYRWNYVSEKDYPCGETRAMLLEALKKAEVSTSVLDNFDVEYRLWHLLYSINDAKELHGALEKWARNNGITNAELFAKVFSEQKPFKSDYASYSEKAIRKLLPYLREGVALHDACYEVYGRYSEGSDVMKWNSPSDLIQYVNNFKQHSLRNPIVEQCILETLRTVGDIWNQIGHIDEIHLELGRELKNPADKRRKISERNLQNEATNQRIKFLLQELLNDKSISDVRPNSPMQQDILRIYEEGALLALDTKDPEFKEISEISRMAQPSQSQLIRYKLWLEQRYLSPYTGRPIPLSRLFTSEYQIEHIIPRSRYYDDSFSNKVICEAEVNELKTNMLAHEFIKAKGGSIVKTQNGSVKVFSQAEYEEFVRLHYSSLREKSKRLMLDEIPEEFIQRQLNDSRYISKVIKSLLSSIVRKEDEDLEMSTNVIVCTGSVTDKLKKDWGLNDVWNNIVYPRYERLNELTNSNLFGQWETKDRGKRIFQTNMPLALQKGYSKKRIDHRHHAMDALVIACASRNIVNFLSNANAHDSNARMDLKNILMRSTDYKHIEKPWKTFTQDTEKALAETIVSFKNSVRILTHASNKYEHFDENNRKSLVRQAKGDMWAVRKPLHKETIFGHVNLRRIKSISIDAAMGRLDDVCDKTLRKLIADLLSKGMQKKDIKKVLASQNYPNKVDVYFYSDEDAPMVAVRKNLDESFDQKRISSITDEGIQKILLRYLETKGNKPKDAFSPEGIEELNANIAQYNNGRYHQPIKKVRVSEPMGEKYAMGSVGNKQKKFVEAQGGTNLYFAIYQKEDGSRDFDTIPLYLAVGRMKQGLPPVPDKNENGSKLIFSLSPNDLVYLPTEDDIDKADIGKTDIDKNRIYKFISSTKKSAFFIPYNISKSLVNIKGNEQEKIGIVHEISVHNSLGKICLTDSGINIKQVCWKLEIDRLGNIMKILR